MAEPIQQPIIEPAQAPLPIIIPTPTPLPIRGDNSDLVRVKDVERELGKE